MKRFATLLLALIMVLSLAAPVFAQDVSCGTNPATITISNASKGETYKVYKLFGATVTGTENGSIAYTGEIPNALEAYFVKDEAGNIFLADNVEESALFAALGEWASSADPTAQAVSDGSELRFIGLEYGYYVVTTTQGDKAITVTSTNPNAVIVDKNSTPPGTDLKKSVDDSDVNFGDKVTYTVEFYTSNYEGEGVDAKKIVSYTITDTLPEFLKDVTVTSITIDGAAYTVDGTTPQFQNNQITIPWVDDNDNNLYENGAQIIITYTAVVTENAAIDGEGNTNTVTLTWKHDDGTDGGGDEYKDEETIYTYAIALKKVDQNGIALAGATFQFPFYVKNEPDTDGAYVYAGVIAGEGLTNTITTPESGLIVVKGVQSGTYSITETDAPDGYNKLVTPVEVEATKTGKTSTSTTVYLDKDGNVTETMTDGGSTVLVEIENLAATAIVVVNMTGSMLPSTGGMGTTVFYMVGGIMVLAAVVLLVTKKRMTAV